MSANAWALTLGGQRRATGRTAIGLNAVRAVLRDAVETVALCYRLRTASR